MATRDSMRIEPMIRGFKRPRKNCCVSVRGSVLLAWITAAPLALIAMEARASDSSYLVVTTRERAGLAHEAFLDSRREVISTQRNPFAGPATAQVVEEPPAPWTTARHAWHYQTKATVFWVGEKPTARNPVSNVASSWDPNWELNYGGYDHPFKRSGFAPSAFDPKMNPFYIALPYNDVTKDGTHRPEAPEVIPWFWQDYRGPGISVCEDRWIAIHHQGRVCYAQWKDVGPFAIDDWRYVFGGERPRPNPNQNAGIDVSPGVRDFLELDSKATVDWRFVEDAEVPVGPWTDWLGAAPAQYTFHGGGSE